ncbi:T9SS type A sorting domain-containing protein [Mangrovimonas xylaniphaga]|uniref:T9SS type A sorting domain-containing protein n=1 Tax=Mangrovimonas xylaniphaga TaxID=1645915 RepID=UPI0006B48B7F|nr:T9SS type A sorting domain-containing protein [Mangrovimonas xylaniphaga]
MDKSITNGAFNQPPTKTPKPIYRSLSYLLFIWLFTSAATLMAQTNITIKLTNSNGINVPEANSATLSVYDSGWKSLTNNGSGVFSYETSSSNVSFRMYFNNGIETKSIAVSGTTQEVVFKTVTVTASLKDKDLDKIPGGTVEYYQNGWSDKYNSNTQKELLPGTYTFKTYFNNGIQTKTAEVSGNGQEVRFRTVTVAQTLKDSDNNILTGGLAQHYQNGWSDKNSSNTPINLLPGSYIFKTYYNNGIETMPVEILPENRNQEVPFVTVTVTPSLKDSENNLLTGGLAQHYQNGWSEKYNSNSSTELLAGTYIFKTYYNNGIENKSNIDISGQAQEVPFVTVTVTPTLTPCNDNTAITGGLVQHYQNGWSSKYDSNTSTELLSGTYHFKTYFNHGIETQNSVVISGLSQNIDFTAVELNINFNEKVQFYQNGWGTYTNPSYLLTGEYIFKYGNISIPNVTIDCNTEIGNVYLFKTLKADGSPLPNVTIKRNDYGTHYVNVGTTDENGNLYVLNADFEGSWKFSASKNYSTQFITSEAGLITFQTSKYVALVMHTNGSAFEDIETEYNDYGTHWINLDSQYTDANGNASIELFPGDFKFRAKKNYSVQENTLELTSSGAMGTVEFQTSTFTTHVKKHDGANFDGIETEYNDYGTHWIDLESQYTDANGNASIELFPGDFKFRAKKNYSVQENTLNIPTSGSTDVVEFQTALAVAHLEDCDTNMPIEGIEVEYNDYGTHWIDLDPQSTGVDGNASIELFPGTYDLRAKNIYTFETKSIILADPSVNTSTKVEFYPTRVCFNSDMVKYNDYGTHWLTLPCNTYMFPGTYDFRFYNNGNLDLETSVAIDGCAQEQAPIFVQLLDSEDNGLANAEFKYRFGYGSYTTIGTDATGNGIWTFIDGNPSNTKVNVSYKDSSKEIQQNVQSNHMFIFNTVKVTADLETSLPLDITNEADNWEYRFGYGPYTSFDPTTGEELLPGNTKVKVSHKGTSKEIQQNTGAISHFDFNTVKVTADLETSLSADITGQATFQYRFGYDSYSILDPVNGEELLPGDTKVKVSHKGTSKEMQQNTGADASFDFNTVQVTASLVESNPDNDITADATWQYRFGYGSYTSFNPIDGEELLSGNTKVQVSYKGTSKEMQQNTGADSSFDFQTVLAMANLCGGTSGTYVYRYGYGPYMPFNPSGEELLPVNTKVKATNDGSTSQEKQQNIGSDSFFEFSFDCVAPTTAAPQVSAFDTQNTVKCYPNPTSEYVTLETDHPGNIFIFNTTGYQVHKGKGKTVNVINYPEGWYFVKAGNYTGKFYVKH